MFQLFINRQPTFFAYFPGEPYFYSTKSKPNPKYCRALVECLSCTNYCPIPLSDRDVFSLRRLRLNRDTLYNNTKVMSSLIDADLMSYYNEALLSRYRIDGQKPIIDDSIRTNQELASTHTKKPQLPVLTKFEIRCISKFRGEDKTFEPNDKSQRTLLQKNTQQNFVVNVKFTGSDILNAFSALAEVSVSNTDKGGEYFQTPLPNWLKKSACRGRNFLEIENRCSKRAASQRDALLDNESIVSQQDDDAMSIAASEMTNWGGQNNSNIHDNTMKLFQVKPTRVSIR